MVRVITVHNFQKQDITSVEEPISIAAVPPDILLLALSNNTIAVKDLQTSDVDYFIPTVDQVIAIVYSIQGNLQSQFKYWRIRIQCSIPWHI